MQANKFSIKHDKEKKCFYVTFFGKRRRIRYNYQFVDLINKFLTLLCLPKNTKLKVTRFFSKKHKQIYEYKFYTFQSSELLTLFNVYKKFPKNILSVNDTINKLVQNKLSISRIGDREELGAMLAESPKSPLLKEALHEICTHGTTENCLVCINNFNVDEKYISEHYRRAFALLSIRVGQTMLEKITFCTSTMYGDAYALYFTSLMKAKKIHKHLP